MDRITHIIWDWNGTLANDSQIAHRIFSAMLEERGQEPVSFQKYRSLYQYPIVNMYSQAGFDLKRESFEGLSEEWISRFNKASVSLAKLHPDTVETLEIMQSRNINQSILSALPHQVLLESVKYQGIQHFFEKIQGLDDNSGYSKLAFGTRLLNELNASPLQTLVVGDSVHDLEVARHLGSRCILITRGSDCPFALKEATKHCGTQVLSNFIELHELPSLQ